VSAVITNNQISTNNNVTNEYVGD